MTNACAYDTYAAAEAAAHTIIGRRGTAAVRKALPDTVAATRGIARRYRRSGRTIKAAEAAVEAYTRALRSWRRHCARIRRQKWSRRPTAPAPGPNLTVPLTERYSLRIRSARIADRGEVYHWLRGRALTGIGPEDVTHADTYSCQVTAYKCWEAWRKGHAPGPTIRHDVTFCLPYIRPADLPGGRRVVNSRLTVAATEIAADEGRVWRATWVVHGRGYQWTSEDGYIVELPREAGAPTMAHGATLLRALAAARRRRTTLDGAAARRDTSDEEVFAGHRDLRVTVADALAAGACHSGVRAWLARHAPHARQSGLTIDEVLAVSDRRAWCIRVCRHVLARAVS